MEISGPFSLRKIANSTRDLEKINAKRKNSLLDEDFWRPCGSPWTSSFAFPPNFGNTPPWENSRAEIWLGWAKRGPPLGGGGICHLSEEITHPTTRNGHKINPSLGNPQKIPTRTKNSPRDPSKPALPSFGPNWLFEAVSSPPPLGSRRVRTNIHRRHSRDTSRPL